jgi:hypothetical protein
MPEVEALQETAEEAAQFEAMLNEQPAPESAPEPQPEPQPEPKADPAPEPAKAAEPAKEPEKPVRLVPHQALHEERERRKQLEQRIVQLEAAAQKAAAPEPIDPDVDPIAALKEVREWKEQQVQHSQQIQQLNEFSGRVKSEEATWAAENPDYGDQIAFLRQSRHNELAALGMGHEQIGQQLMIEALQTADVAFRSGKNPGEVFTTLAVTRGWKAKEPEAEKTVIKEPSKEAAEKVDRLARGQKAATSSSGSGGGAPDDEMTVEKLLGLTGAAFDTAFAKHGRRLMGG